MPDSCTEKVQGQHHDNALLANAPPWRNARVSSHEMLQGAREKKSRLLPRKRTTMSQEEKTLLCSRQRMGGVGSPRNLRQNACSIA